MDTLFGFILSALGSFVVSYVTVQVKLATQGKAITDHDRRIEKIETKHDAILEILHDRFGRLEESVAKIEATLEYMRQAQK